MGVKIDEDIMMDILTNERLGFGQLTNHRILLCYVRYLLRQTPAFHYATTWGYITDRLPSWSFRDKDKPIFIVKFYEQITEIICYVGVCASNVSESNASLVVVGWLRKVLQLSLTFSQSEISFFVATNSKI